jgi:hypothetical protein
VSGGRPSAFLLFSIARAAGFCSVLQALPAGGANPALQQKISLPAVRKHAIIEFG